MKFCHISCYNIIACNLRNESQKYLLHLFGGQPRILPSGKLCIYVKQPKIHIFVVSSLKYYSQRSVIKLFLNFLLLLACVYDVGGCTHIAEQPRSSEDSFMGSILFYLSMGSVNLTQVTKLTWQALYFLSPDLKSFLNIKFNKGGKKTLSSIKFHCK